MIHKEEIPDSPLFAGIHPEEKESILKCLSAVEKKYEKGDAVFLAGTAIRSMGFILSGSVDISRDDFWGNRQVLGHAGSGEHGLSGLRLVDKGGKSDHDHDTGNDRHESLTGHCDGTVRELQSRDRYDRGKGLCVGSE